MSNKLQKEKNSQNVKQNQTGSEDIQERKPHHSKASQSKSGFIKTLIKYFWKAVGAIRHLYRKIDRRFHFIGERIFDSVILEMIISAAFIFLCVVGVIVLNRVTLITSCVILYVVYLVYNFFSLRYYYRHTKELSMYYKTNYTVFILMCAIMFTMANHFKYADSDGIYTYLFFPFKWVRLIFGQYGRLRSAFYLSIPNFIMITIVPFITKKRRHGKSLDDKRKEAEEEEKKLEEKNNTENTNNAGN